MHLEVIRPTKTASCVICGQIINAGFQVRATRTYSSRSAHLECLNEKAKEMLEAEGRTNGVEHTE